MIDLPIAGMCCAEKAARVGAALGRLPGVQEVRALPSAERATVAYDPRFVPPGEISAAVRKAGFTVSSDCGR